MAELVEGFSKTITRIYVGLGTVLGIVFGYGLGSGTLWLWLTILLLLVLVVCAYIAYEFWYLPRKIKNRRSSRFDASAQPPLPFVKVAPDN